MTLLRWLGVCALVVAVFLSHPYWRVFKTPASARDLQRTRDLDAIADEVRGFYVDNPESKEDLRPRSLTALRTKAGSELRGVHFEDPYTGRPYTYRADPDRTHITLCATFETDNMNDNSTYYPHPKGPTCWRFDPTYSAIARPDVLPMSATP